MEPHPNFAFFENMVPRALWNRDGTELEQSWNHPNSEPRTPVKFYKNIMQLFLNMTNMTEKVMFLIKNDHDFCQSLGERAET